MTEEIPKVAPINPVKKLLFLNGVLSAMMIKHPLNIPPPPMPAIARPIIRARELGAAPQTALPTSKRPIAERNTHFVLNREYARPNGSWKAQVVRRKAALYYGDISTRYTRETTSTGDKLS